MLKGYVFIFFELYVIFEIGIMIILEIYIKGRL